MKKRGAEAIQRWIKDGRVKRVGEKDFEVHKPDAHDPLHMVFVEEIEGREAPFCHSCREKPRVARIQEELECEKAVRFYLRHEARDERRQQRRERLRKKSPGYDRARRQAPEHSLTFLHDLLRSNVRIPEEEDPQSEYWKDRPGRPPTDPRDMMLCAIVYASIPNYSLAEAHPFLVRLYEDGYIQHRPALNWPSKMLNKPWFTEELKRLIPLSAVTLFADVEILAIDGTGQSRVKRNHYRTYAWGARGPPKPLSDAWNDYKEYSKRRLYDGLHVATSPDLGLFVSATVGPGHRHDGKFMPELLEIARHHGCMFNKVLADAAYQDHELMELITSYHAVPFIPLRKNATRDGPKSRAWRDAWDRYWQRPDDFDRVYGQRALVEGSFSALKTKFGERVKSQNEVARHNEILCRVLRYNAGRVLQLLLERGTTHLSMRSWSRPERPPRASAEPISPAQVTLLQFTHHE